MEEDIRKQGILYLQQSRFGKKWKRVWCVLFRESSCSISRLEFFDCKDERCSEKNLRKQQEHKKVIRLSSCIRVTEVELDGSPRDTGTFLIETTDKSYVFAAERGQVEDWTHRVCEVAFPMSWVEPSVKRGSLHRGRRVEEDEGMEDNSLYSGRETVRDFRVCVRRTEASDRCRLKGDGVLRADVDALLLLDKSGDIMFTWPYRYLRRFGRDKVSFSFEAGRRCESGEGSFEFDTKQGNVLFQAVEAAIHLQRLSAPQRQASGGGGLNSPDTPQDLSLPSMPLCPPLAQSRTPPLPQPRLHVPQPPAAQEAEGVYSTVTDPPNNQVHPRDKERPLLCRLEPPVDKTLTGVKSLTLDTRGSSVPRKNAVKMISSCPLPHNDPEPAPPNPHPHLSPKPSSSDTYSQITLPAAERGTRREKRGGGGGGGGVAHPCTPPLIPPDPDYSLPFDTIAVNVMANILNSHDAPGTECGADPLYDSIDEMKIRNVFTSDAPAHRKVEHIYDEPEGCAVPTSSASSASSATKALPTSVYDDPEEMKGDAWRIMGIPADPKGHEYPYDPRMDDYAVPKRPQRACPVSQGTNKEEEEGEGPPDKEEGSNEEGEGPGEEEEGLHDSPYNNVMVKMT